MRSFTRRSGAAPVAFLIASLLCAPALRADPAADLSTAAAAWLASLDEEQRDEVEYDFEDDERFDLRLAPILLEGLRRDAMSEAQWQAWRAVLATTLSESGLRTVETIMSLEREVEQRDGESLFGRWFGGFIHGEGRYFASLYGDPADGAPWGLRFDGHHLSLNWTVAGAGAISVTPLFLGGEPREVAEGFERAGLRVLEAEEDAGLAVWRALSAEQRTAAKLPFAFASGIAGGSRSLFLGEGERVEPGVPQGIEREALDETQRAALDALVEVYLANFETSIATSRRAAIDAAGRGEIYFATAGSLVPGDAGYYRVQGPTFLIEFDNTVEEADHVHAIWREFDGDFGRDLLAEHHAQAH